MSRLSLVTGGLSLLVVAGLVGVALAWAPRPATDAERVERLAAGMRCPDCQALSVADSRTRAAAAIRDEIAGLVAAGRTDDEVRDHFVARYGAWILLAPDDPLAWWLPAGAVLLGVAAFGLWLWTARSRPGAVVAEPAPAPLADADRRRVRDELEALDG